MNYIIVYRRDKVLKSLFMICNSIDTVIDIMEDMLDDNTYVIRETLLDLTTFREDNENIIKRLEGYLDE